MPSSVLTINTTQFDAALRKSGAELGAVELKATGVDRALQTMVRKFSGADLERELKLAATAVQRVGGAANLTTAQQDQLLRKTRELNTQYRALQRTAPDAIADLSRELEEAARNAAGLASQGAGIERSFGASIVSGAVAGGVAAIGSAAIGALGHVGRLVVEGLSEVVTRGSEISQVRGAFLSMAGGVSEASRVIAASRTSTRGLLTDLELTAAATKAMTLGLPVTASEFATLSGSAVTLGRAMRLGPVQAVSDLVEGLGKGSAEVLNNLGIIVRADDAYAKHAAAIGKSKDALTASEKQLAIYRAGLDAAAAKVAAMGDQQLTFADRVRQVVVGWDNFTDGIAEAVATSPAVNVAMAAVGDALASAFGPNREQAIRTIVQWVNVAAVSAVMLAERFATFAKVSVQANAAALAAVTAFAGGVLRAGAQAAGAAAQLADLNARVMPFSGWKERAAEARAFGAALDGQAASVERLANAYGAQARGESGAAAFFGNLATGLDSLALRMGGAIAEGKTYVSGLGAIAPAAAAAGDAVAGKAAKDREAEAAARRAGQAITAQVDAMRKLAGIDVAEDAARLVGSLRQLDGLGLRIAPPEAAGAVETLRKGIAALETQGLEVDEAWRGYLVTLEDVARGHAIAASTGASLAEISKNGAAAMRDAFGRVATLQREVSDARQLQGMSAQWRKLTEIAFDYRDAIEGVADGQTFVRRELERLGSNVTPELRRQLEAIGARLDRAARVELEALGQKFGTVFESAVLETKELRDALLLMLDGLAMINPAAKAAADQIRDLYPDKGGKDPAAAPRDLSNAWLTALGDMSRALAEFSQISGGSLSGVAGQLAELVGLMNVAGQAGKAIGDGIRAGGVAGYAQAATGGIQAATAIYAATNVEGRGQRALRGAGTGASAGFTATAATGNPYIIAGATAGGAIVGALVGAFRKPGFETEMKRVSASFGVEIQKEFAGAIDKARGQFGGDRVATELSFLPQIIEAAGGISDKNVGKLTARLRDVYSMVDAGKFSADQARQTLDAAFPAFAAHVEQSGKVASAQFVELISLNRQFGIESRQIGAFVSQQTERMGGAAVALLGPARKTFEDLAAARDKALAGVGTGEGADNRKAAISLDYAKQIAAAGQAAQPEIERISRLMAAGFNAAVRQGGDLVAVLDQFGPGLDQASALMRELGIDSANTAIAGVAAFREKVQINRELVDSTQALNEFTLALSNVGGLTAESFADVQAQVRGQIEAMRTAGFTDAEAFSIARGSLETVVDAATRLRLPIDESTEAILEAARAAGVLEQTGTGTNDILREGFGLLIELLGGQVPAAWEASAQAAVDASTEARQAVATVTRELADDDPWRAFAREGREAAEEVSDAINRIPRNVGVGVTVAGDARPEGSFATGSMGVRNFGSGTLALLHGREAIVPEWQYKRRFDPGMFDGAGGSGGGAVSVVVELDGAVLTEGILPRFGGRLAVRGIR